MKQEQSENKNLFDALGWKLVIDCDIHFLQGGELHMKSKHPKFNTVLFSPDISLTFSDTFIVFVAILISYFCLILFLCLPPVHPFSSALPACVIFSYCLSLSSSLLSRPPHPVSAAFADALFTHFLQVAVTFRRREPNQNPSGLSVN